MSQSSDCLIMSAPGQLSLLETGKQLAEVNEVIN